jgi:hypothetical protein
MIIELTYKIKGGTNLALEKSWGLIKTLMIKYPSATWKKITDVEKGVGKYIIII